MDTLWMEKRRKICCQVGSKVTLVTRTSKKSKKLATHTHVSLNKNSKFKNSGGFGPTVSTSNLLRSFIF